MYFIIFNFIQLKKKNIFESSNEKDDRVKDEKKKEKNKIWMNDSFAIFVVITFFYRADSNINGCVTCILNQAELCNSYSTLLTETSRVFTLRRRKEHSKRRILFTQLVVQTSVSILPTTNHAMQLRLSLSKIPRHSVLLNHLPISIITKSTNN